MPALQMSLEAHSLGLASCFLSPNIRSANKLVGVSSPNEVVILIGVGALPKKSTAHRSERKPLAEIVSFETFGRVANGKS